MNISYQPDQPVSVSFVCKNKASTFPRVLTALAQGIRRPDLVLLADDGSTDGSPEVFARQCKALGLEHRVLDIPPGQPFRINSMRNAGIRAAPDGLVLVLDADLVPARTALDAHRRMHLERAGRPIVSTGPRLEYATEAGDGPVNFMWGFEMVGHVSSPPEQQQKFPTWQVTPGSLMAMTRRAVEHVGWFDEGYDGHYGYDDVDFMIRAEQAGFEFVGDWEAHVIHVPHPPSLGHRDGSRNAARFAAKYGRNVEVPSLLLRLNRKPWNELYRELMAGRGEVLEHAASLPLDEVPLRLLMRTMSNKVLRRVRGRA